MLTFATSASTSACSPSGLTTVLSAFVTSNLYLSSTRTLTSLFGRSAYAASHCAGDHCRCSRTVSTRSMSDSASPTVWLIRSTSALSSVEEDLAIACRVEGEKMTVPCPLASK